MAAYVRGSRAPRDADPAGRPAAGGVEAVDRALGHVTDAVHASGGTCLITADHGNAEHMLEADGSPNTAHTTNPVPLIVTRPGLALRDTGILGDVAPTVLELLAVEQPTAMTGRSLIEATVAAAQSAAR